MQKIVNAAWKNPTNTLSSCRTFAKYFVCQQLVMMFTVKSNVLMIQLKLIFCHFVIFKKSKNSRIIIFVLNYLNIVRHGNLQLVNMKFSNADSSNRMFCVSIIHCPFSPAVSLFFFVSIFGLRWINHKSYFVPIETKEKKKFCFVKCTRK